MRFCVVCTTVASLKETRYEETGCQLTMSYYTFMFQTFWSFPHLTVVVPYSI